MKFKDITMVKLPVKQISKRRTPYEAWQIAQYTLYRSITSMVEVLLAPKQGLKLSFTTARGSNGV